MCLNTESRLERGQCRAHYKHPVSSWVIVQESCFTLFSCWLNVCLSFSHHLYKACLWPTRDLLFNFPVWYCSCDSEQWFFQRHVPRMRLHSALIKQQLTRLYYVQLSQVSHLWSNFSFFPHTNFHNQYIFFFFVALHM